jgi:hypothetical protein
VIDRAISPDVMPAVDPLNFVLFLFNGLSFFDDRYFLAIQVFVIWEW